MPRSSTSIGQKAKLRAYHKANPHLRYKALQAWFLEQFHCPIAQSSVSEVLSAKYAWLDSEANIFPAYAKRRRTEHWPELENALLEWLDRVQDHKKVTGDAIRAKAQFFFESIPAYSGIPTPCFSNGWLMNFRSRRKRRQSLRRSEAADINNAVAAQDIERARELLLAFPPQDRYNCDETTLFWKHSPDRSQPTRSVPSVNKHEARVTVQFCCNAEGTDRLPLWFIGTARSPRAFGAAGVNVKALGVEWRHNSTACMMRGIFEEWLRWFDARMNGRKVALLMDTLSAHEAAFASMERLTEGLGLQNTTVVWIPPANRSGVCQPLDHGIIKAWKTLYRMHWLQYMLEEVEVCRDPVSTMNVLKAVRWGKRAWQSDLDCQTIKNGWIRAGFLQGEELPSANFQPDVQARLDQLQEQQVIKEAMDIESFLFPAEESLHDNSDHIDREILAAFAPAVEQESDEEIEVLTKVTADQALRALQVLRLHEEQAEDGNPWWVSHLDRQERVVMARKFRQEQHVLQQQLMLQQQLQHHQQGHHGHQGHQDQRDMREYFT